MEVVTTLCFGGDSMPEPELIKMLMDIIFTENDSTRDLTPFTDAKGDKSPIVRSSLLQLLLEHKYKSTTPHIPFTTYTIHHTPPQPPPPPHTSSPLHYITYYSSEDVRVHLQDYFERSQKVLAGHVDEYLCLLCIQCFEVDM